VISSRILRVLSGPDTGRIFPVTGTRLTVGQDHSSDVRLTAPDIAGHHAILEETDGRFLVRDLESAAGTFLNGNPVQMELLNPGDKLTFGSTVVQYWVQGLTPDPSVRPVPTVKPPDEALLGEIRSLSSPYLPTDQVQEIQLSLTEDDVSALFRQPPEPAAADPDSLVRAYRSLNALYEINKVLGTTFDVETVLARVLDIVLSTVDGDRGVVMLSDPSSEMESLCVARRHPGKAHPDDEGPSLKISKTIAQHVLESSEAVLTSDAAADARFRAGDSVLGLNIKSAMCVPLTGRREPLGIIFVDAGDRNVFTEDSLRLLATIADIAGKVIENARLYTASLDAERLAAVGETVAGTAHYMKNLLTGLMAGAELVDLGLETTDLSAVSAGWAPIRKNLDIVSDLVLNMLDFSRDRRPAFQPIDVAELLDDLVELVRHRAEGRNISVSTEISEDVPALRADAVAVHRAVLNLLTNAIDAVPEDAPGDVRVGATLEGTDVVLHVTDNGMGIPDSVLPQIFDIFCTTKGSRGTGFGLAVTRKIVEEHGGRIEVDTVVGEGTTFRILIPA
jgi:signal transduction histidine kinase